MKQVAHVSCVTVLLLSRVPNLRTLPAANSRGSGQGTSRCCPVGGLLVRIRVVHKMSYEILQLSVVVDVKVFARSNHDTRPIHGLAQAVGALKTSV